MDVQPHLLNLSAYINQNLEKDLPLSSLAKRVGLSPFHFHRKFGAYFGESLHQHIKRLRLERAAFSLSFGSKPVRDIARESGYKTVSAFSHAFSGFAGQSPTRYRSRGALNGVDVDTVHDEPVPATTAPKPAWIGMLDEQPFAFVRAEGQGWGRQASVSAAQDVVTSTLAAPAPMIRTAFNGGAPVARDDATAGPHEFIWATSDLYGVAKKASFRVAVGVDANRVPADRTDALGHQVLAGGRYARFELSCDADDLVEQCYRACVYGLEGTNETIRPVACYVRFFDDDTEGPRTYRLFVPLASQ